MRKNDVIAQLREANRVSEATLSQTDRGVLDALREGITMTDRTASTAPAPRRRLMRRGALVAGLSLTVIGGGAAYAAYQQLYLATDDDHLTCMTEWAPSTEGYPDALSGPVLTGDPVADCQAIQEHNGAPPITDPVAFRLDGETFVAPRSQVPGSATLIEGSTPDGPAALELQASLVDMVDGLESRCFTQEEATAFARSEMDRLGLVGWQVEESVSEAALPCTLASVDATNRTVDVVADSGWEPVTSWPDDDPSAHVYAMRDALRDGVAAGCLALEDAESAALAAGAGSTDGLTVVTIPDPEAACTRVDLTVGGSWLVTLRGPEVVAP